VFFLFPPPPSPPPPPISKAFQQELGWAAHIGIPSLIFPTPTSVSVNYANQLNEAVKTLGFASIWVRIPMVSPKSGSEEGGGRTLAGRPENDPWEWWDTLRTLIEHHPKVSVGEFCLFHLPFLSHLQLIILRFPQYKPWNSPESCRMRRSLQGGWASQ